MAIGRDISIILEYSLANFEIFLLMKKKNREPTFQHLFRCLHQGIKSETSNVTYIDTSKRR